jgi:hypothetical protein
MPQSPSVLESADSQNVPHVAASVLDALRLEPGTYGTLVNLPSLSAAFQFTQRADSTISAGRRSISQV